MPEQAPKLDVFRLNKEIAYAGSIGKKRKDFCIDFIKKKKETISDIQAGQVQAAAKNGEKITCHDGCAYCCLFYMHASIQECEAIVYYLYNNEDAYEAYLKNYANWREKLRQNGDIFQKCAQLWYEKIAPGAGLKESQAFNDESVRYRDQNLRCPFLNNGSCSIYEVRPFLCAGTVATTPGEWCYKSKNSPKIYKTQSAAIFDKSFYYKEIDEFILTFFPITVYYILEGGYKMLARITGLEDLEEKVLQEPEVKKVMERLS
jgi:hypothetical protein